MDHKSYLNIQNKVLIPLQLLGAVWILFGPLLILGYLLVIVPTVILVYFNYKFKDLIKEEKNLKASKSGLDTSDDAEKRRQRYGLSLLGAFLLSIVLTSVSPSFNDGYFIIPFMYFGILILIFGMIGLSIADHAQKKGKSWSTFFWLSLLISPVITGIIVATISPEQGKILPGTKACPKCAEPVKTEAILCKHCGSDI
jgi:hypothetical protein